MAEAGRARLSSEREIEIADLAEGVVETHCLGSSIDPERIISRKGISLFYDHYDNAFDGMLEHEDGRFYIHCNLDRENLPGSPRGRFTLAHELGHYFIDEHRNNLISGEVPPHPSCSDRTLADLTVEREADFFASRLLLPESRFRSAVKKASLGMQGIKEIAEKFEVSLTCAAIRFVSTEVFPCILVKWSDNGFCWKWCSSKFWEYGYRRTIQSLEKVPRDSATTLCREQSGGSDQIFKSATTASFVFPSIGHKSVQNVIMQEEAMSLGRFGTLSLYTLQNPFPKEVIEARARWLGAE